MKKTFSYRVIIAVPFAAHTGDHVESFQLALIVHRRQIKSPDRKDKSIPGPVLRANRPSGRASRTKDVFSWRLKAHPTTLREIQVVMTAHLRQTASLPGSRDSDVATPDLVRLIQPGTAGLEPVRGYGSL